MACGAALQRPAGRMRQRGGYGSKFSHRFGTHDGLPAKRAGVKRIWLQAVSVGEMLAIAPILEALAKMGTVEVYLTTSGIFRSTGGCFPAGPGRASRRIWSF